MNKRLSAALKLAANKRRSQALENSEGAKLKTKKQKENIMNQEFYNRREAIKHGEKLWKQGNREFAMSRYITAEGVVVYFFDWLASFSTPESICEMWTNYE